MTHTYDWQFPLPRTHTGILMGNGTVGAMVWGGGQVLNITLNRADFWDHRGGKPWTADMSFVAIRRLLEAGDEKGLRRVFEDSSSPEGQPRRPSVIPLGRLELRFADSLRLVSATLRVGTGRLDVRLEGNDGRSHVARLEVPMDEPVVHVALPEGVLEPSVSVVTSWEYVGEHLTAISFERPEFHDRDGVRGWVQARPVDPPLAVSYRVGGGSLWVALCYGGTAERARGEARGLIERHEEEGAAALSARCEEWWRGYWLRVPCVDIPEERLSFLYHYGMYKFAGFTNPGGVAATLQGPWVEEFRMPPWSSDYHFNINVQMCYWPAYQGNLLEHLRPLFDMVWGWRDRLRENARLFAGVEDGYLLPHAVDDRCTCMGGFWTGTIDHACTAWVAKMMYDYWLYGGDKPFLGDVAFPFMKGAMRVYEAMLERVDGRLRLPVSVSPEYRGSSMDAWGRDASFQLGAVHWLAESLTTAAGVLGEEVLAVWSDIRRTLPVACVETVGTSARVMLWAGTDLEESHRHHSHMAGLYPWDVIDIDQPHWREVFGATYQHWLAMGMGRWTGWCLPWAGMLHARAGSADFAVAMLEYMQRIYTDEGHGTMHDPRLFRTNLGGAEPVSMLGGERSVGYASPMQMDAGMAAAAAVMDFLVHTRRGILRLFEGAPASWRHVSFEGIRVEGGFLVSARRSLGTVVSLAVEGPPGRTVRIENPWGAGERNALSIEGGVPADMAADVLDIVLGGRGRVAICGR